MSASNSFKKEPLPYEIRDANGQLIVLHYRRDTKDGKRLWWSLLLLSQQGNTPIGGVLRGALGFHAVGLAAYRQPAVAISSISRSVARASPRALWSPPESFW